MLIKCDIFNDFQPYPCNCAVSPVLSTLDPGLCVFRFLGCIDRTARVKGSVRMFLAGLTEEGTLHLILGPSHNSGYTVASLRQVAVRHAGFLPKIDFGAGVIEPWFFGYTRRATLISGSVPYFRTDKFGFSPQLISPETGEAIRTLFHCDNVQFTGTWIY